MNMASISKREKIILLVMALVVLLGGINLLLSSSSKKLLPASISNDLKQMSSLVLGAAEALKKNELSEAEALTIALAESQWTRDPFLSGAEPFKRGERKMDAAEEINFLYSGYLDAAGRKMAIIDGLEYNINEELEISGYFVREIHPTKIIIEAKDEQGVVRKITVPLAE